MKSLRLWLVPLVELGAESAIDFEVIDGDRRVLERGSAVPAALPRHARTELVVAAPDVLLFDATVPRLSGSRQRAALPAVAEPMLIGDIAQSFIVSGRPDASGRSTLAVLDRALFRRALELLKRLGIKPASATPEPLALVPHGGRWRLRLGSAYATLRMGERLGIVCSTPVDASPPVELRLALEQAGTARPDAIEVEGEYEFDAAGWTAVLGVPVVTAAVDDARAAPVALELLQYEFAPGIADWRAWRVPAALAATLLLIWIAGLNIDAWLKLREEGQLRAAMTAAFREAFPQVPVVLDPVAQMRRAVADLKAGAGADDASDFLPLAAAFARAAEQGPDAVREMEYRDRALHVQFGPKTLEVAANRDSLTERLAKAGLQARFSDGRLVVRAEGKL
jgi:general secretion pathway protein L